MDGNKHKEEVEVEGGKEETKGEKVRNKVMALKRTNEQKCSLNKEIRMQRRKHTQTYSFIVLLSLQSFGDIRDGLYG